MSQYLPVCASPGWIQRTCKCLGIPESEHTHAHSPRGAVQDAEHGPESIHDKI